MKQPYADRVRRVTDIMAQEELDQIIVTSTPSVFYLTGLWIDPFERMLALYLDVDGRLTLFGNTLFAIDRDRQSFACVLHSDGDNPVKQLSSLMRPGRIGIDKFWPSKFLIGLMDLRPDLKPVAGSAPVDRARMRKDSEEIDRMRHASAQNDLVMDAAIHQLREGVTEAAMASFLADEYSRIGADFPVGQQMVSFGPNAADPHHVSGKSALKPGDCVLFDIDTPFDRYWCDMTRTVYFRTVSREEESIYETVRRAGEAAMAAIRPGLPLSQIDASARRIIAEAGYGSAFTHRLGHGIGLDCHEPPDCAPGSETIAEPGMVFSVEPGIYITGKYGVRIENLVLVTETGCQSLNNYPSQLTVL
jgi:Xaa-Pro dipeptidase